MSISESVCVGVRVSVGVCGHFQMTHWFIAVELQRFPHL